MKLKIIFEEIDDLDGSKKTFQTTFTGVSQEIQDDTLVNFANAYATLVENDGYSIFKIIETEL